MVYFSYGSNLSTVRMRERVPSANIMGVATLFRYRLCFRKVGMDGSAKCDVRRTGKGEDRVIGVLYDIEKSEKPILDALEDLGKGYRECTIEVLASSGNSVSAFTYVATRIDPELKPFGWYREHVLRGLEEHQFPGWYREQIEKVPCVKDPDAHRHLRELAIYP